MTKFNPVHDNVYLSQERAPKGGGTLVNTNAVVFAVKRRPGSKRAKLEALKRLRTDRSIGKPVTLPKLRFMGEI